MANTNDVTVYLVLLVAITTIGPLQFGFHLAELNAPQDVLMCRKKSVTTRTPSYFATLTDGVEPKPGAFGLPSCIPMNDASFAAISSLFTIGALMGALYSGPFASCRGRLLAMRSTAVLFCAGSIVETFAAAVWTMAVGRIISGAAAGAATVIVPLYVSEIAPAAMRGFFGFFTQISINVGILVVQSLGYFLSHDSAWRWILASGAIAAIIQMIGLLVVPESPVWTATHGDADKAQRILHRIRGETSGADEEADELAQAERIATEQEALLAEDGRPGSSPLTVVTWSQSRADPLPHLGFAQVLRDPFYRPAIMAVVGIQFIQQLCGINSVIMYSVSLLAGLLPVSSVLLTILISVVNLLVTFACAPLPDKLGRKRCLLISICGQGISAFVLASSILLEFKIISAVAVVTFVGFFAVGLGPVPFLLASELVGQEAVGATQSWSLASNYIATFVVAQFFPIVNVALNEILGGAGGWVYFIFAAFSAAGTLFIMTCVPETKRMKDADEVWGRVRRVD